MEAKIIARWEADIATVVLFERWGSYIYEAVDATGASRGSGCLAATTEDEAVRYMESYLVRGARRLPVEG